MFALVIILNGLWMGIFFSPKAIALTPATAARRRAGRPTRAPGRPG